jgi:hypothetical protein
MKKLPFSGQAPSALAAAFKARRGLRDFAEVSLKLFRICAISCSCSRVIPGASSPARDLQSRVARRDGHRRTASPKPCARSGGRSATPRGESCARSSKRGFCLDIEVQSDVPTAAPESVRSVPAAQSRPSLVVLPFQSIHSLRSGDGRLSIVSQCYAAPRSLQAGGELRARGAGCP